MIDYKKYINALRKCAKEHKNDITPFAHIIVSDLCIDTANLLESLEQESVLDKIKVEIKEERDTWDKWEDADRYYSYDKCLEIINKKWAESECINYEECEELAGCPCEHYKTESEN